MTPLVVMSQPTRCTYIGADERLPPLRTPRRVTAPGGSDRTRVGAAIAVALAEKRMSADKPLTSGSARSPTASNCFAIAPLGCGPPGDPRPTVRGRSSGPARKAGPPSKTTGCAPPLSHRTSHAQVAAVPLADGRGSMTLCPTLVSIVGTSALSTQPTALNPSCFGGHANAQVRARTNCRDYRCDRLSDPSRRQTRPGAQPSTA